MLILSTQKLADAIALFNEIRTRLQNLYTLRSKNPNAISGSDMHALVKASMMMDRSDFLAKLSDLDQAFKDQVAESGETRKTVAFIRWALQYAGCLPDHRKRRWCCGWR